MKVIGSSKLNGTAGVSFKQEHEDGSHEVVDWHVEVNRNVVHVNITATKIRAGQRAHIKRVVHAYTKASYKQLCDTLRHVLHD